MTTSRGLPAHRDMAKVGDMLNAASSETVAQQAAQLLATRPEQDWRLSDLAELVHLSASQLGRAFKRELGTSPMQYLTRVRAHRLAHLLLETDLPIGAAMSQVGWRSRGHAARHFTAVMGVSPSTYRKAAPEQDSARSNLCAPPSKTPS